MTPTPEQDRPEPATHTPPAEKAPPGAEAASAEEISQAAEATSPEPETPEEERSRLATAPDPTLHDTAAVDADGVGRRRGSVEWVRPTDLAARGGASVLAGSADFNRQLAAAVKEAAHEQRDRLSQRLAERASQIDIDTPHRTQTPAAGREGVSR